MTASTDPDSMGDFLRGLPEWDGTDDRFFRISPKANAVCYYRPELDREPSMVPKQMADAFRACRTGKAPWPLFVSSDAGGGKTRFGLLVSDWYGGIMADFATIVDEYRLCKCGELHDELYENRPLIRETAYRKRMRDHRIVVVDDIGQRDVSDHARETLMLILNEREGPHPTVLISNLPLSQLSALYDDRVASRMAAGTVIGVNGVDMRIDRTIAVGELGK